MNVHIVLCLIILSLKKNFSHGQIIRFKLEDSYLAATEGSCAEIKCKVTSKIDDLDSDWFWMKDAVWNINRFNASIIISKNISLHPIRPDFATRVKYTGTPSSQWKSSNDEKRCSILICNLTKGDSGNYSFRYVGREKWVTKPALYLNVTENPCPITFEKPPVVKEDTTVMLKCSTLNSCPLYLTMMGPTPLSRSQHQQIRVNFTPSWKDDGKELSCQTQDNKDIYLKRTNNLTVEYAPKNTQAEIIQPDIVEGKTVTLTCSAKGNPLPTFTWIQNETVLSQLAQWVIPSISVSQSGTYHCRAQNKHGTKESPPLVIDVKYFPQVEIKGIPSPLNIEEGYTMFLTCEVRSNPEPCSYTWFKNQKTIGEGKLYNKTIEPDDVGSYTCRAINTVGPGESQPILISVKYGPRRTNISSSVNVSGVKAGYRLTLSCNTDANPAPMIYSWYRYSNNKLIEPPQWKSKTTNDSKLSFEHVQRTDEACYMCNATNIIRTGENSGPVCLNVHYAPTNLKLFMESEVEEGQLININCTVESFPASTLKLMRDTEILLTTNSQFGDQRSNKLYYRHKATSDHTGFYSCAANNTEGSDDTLQVRLTVKHIPKEVEIHPHPGLVVKENASLTLSCSAKSHPAVISFTWAKVTDGNSDVIHRNQTMTINSVGPSDSGLYFCSASNEMGTGESKQVEVTVKYAPKHTHITREAELQNTEGRSFVKLTCNSQSFPPVKKYEWYQKAKRGDIRLTDGQTYNVYSDAPGMYYCVAKHEISDRLSDPVELFADRDFMKALKFILPVLLIFLSIFLIFFIYRWRQNKAIRQNTNVPWSLAFLASGRRGAMNRSNEQEPSRSRDDLLPDQLCNPKAQWRQPQPDSTPASNISSVCSTVDLLAAEGPSAQKPTKQKGGQTEDESIKYAALHFGHKEKWNTNGKAEENIVYAMVSRPKPPENKEQGLEVYENVTAAQVANTPNQWSDDTDTSEDEVDIGYTQVTFTPKPGHQRGSKNSSSSEEEIQYSDIKV